MTKMFYKNGALWITVGDHDNDVIKVALLMDATTSDPQERGMGAKLVKLWNQGYQDKINSEMLEALELALEWNFKDDLSDGLPEKYWAPEFKEFHDKLKAVIAKAKGLGG